MGSCIHSVFVWSASASPSASMSSLSSSSSTAAWLSMPSVAANSACFAFFFCKGQGLDWFYDAWGGCAWHAAQRCDSSPVTRILMEHKQGDEASRRHRATGAIPYRLPIPEDARLMLPTKISIHWAWQHTFIFFIIYTSTWARRSTTIHGHTHNGGERDLCSSMFSENDHQGICKLMQLPFEVGIAINQQNEDNLNINYLSVKTIPCRGEPNKLRRRSWWSTAPSLFELPVTFMAIKARLQSHISDM